MITKTQTVTDWDGERFLVDFAYSGGGAAGLAVKRDDGWHWYDPKLQQRLSDTPVLSTDACDDPIEAAINSLIARKERSGAMSPTAREAYANALRNEPRPAPVIPCCHYCGIPIDPRRTTVGFFGEYQCQGCS